jgi:chaperonin cofactor prefoldin
LEEKTTVQLAQELGRLEVRFEKVTKEKKEILESLNEVKEEILSRIWSEKDVEQTV